MINPLDQNDTLDQGAALNSLTSDVYTIAVPILMGLCTLAVMANGLILLVSRWIPTSRMKPPLKLTLSLAGADAWTSTVIGIGLFAHSYAPWVLRLPKPSWHECASYGLEALRLGGMLTSVLHLFALSLTQYFAAAHPHKYKAWLVGCRLRLIHGVIIGLWVAPPSLFFILFGAYSHRTFMGVHNESDLDTARNACSHDFLDTLGVRLLVFFIVSLPIAFMTVVYVKIFVVLIALRRDANRECLDRTVAHCNQNRLNRFRRYYKRVITTLLTVSTFVIGWIPAVTLFAITCPECAYPYTELRKNHPSVFFSLTITGNVLIISKGLMNPFIYAIRIPEIQDAIKVVLHWVTAQLSRSQRGSMASYYNCSSRRSECDTFGTFDETTHRGSIISAQVEASPRLCLNRRSNLPVGR